MEFTIIDEPNETLKVVKHGENGTAVIVKKRRESALDDWDTTVIILNRREALLINRALSQIMLEPAPTYEVTRSTVVLFKTL